MKVVLFCQNAYCFEIMRPIMAVLKERRYTYTWFITPKLTSLFPFKEEPVTESLQALIAFHSDAIICPGNEVPHYLRGVKVQIFHGLAGEKKGHFRIRHYFDLYLTQGPYFTSRFKEFQKRYKNFEVAETGWSKLDAYTRNKSILLEEKKALLHSLDADKVLLYAPTFSPSLTSATHFKSQLEALATTGKFIINIKFHDLMAKEFIDYYKALSERYPTVFFKEGRDIVAQFIVADVLISDTSSVIYEFLLLDKPVITLNNISENIKWDDIKNPEELSTAVINNLKTDPFKKQRAAVIAAYHPYHDGKSSERMVNAMEHYISKNGVPEKRKLSLFRQYKINKIFKR
jgi:CDP-glycerol glycerophosphotransferase (TagB/SpsB family)